MRWLFLSLCILGGLLALGLRHLPPEWDPRTPLNLGAPPNLLTGLKLGWMTQRPEACFAAFAASGIPLVRVPDRASEIGCELQDVVRLPTEARAVPGVPLVTCPLAAAWVLFERNSLQPAAQRYLDSRVVGFRHLGTHACRNVNHAQAGRRSQHATANAIDIAGFVLQGRRDVRLVQDWSGTAAEAEFLRAVRDGACRWFRAVLGPDYNAAHQDHFHFDMGPWRSCR